MNINYKKYHKKYNSGLTSESGKGAESFQFPARLCDVSSINRFWTLVQLLEVGQSLAVLDGRSCSLVFFISILQMLLLSIF